MLPKLTKQEIIINYEGTHKFKFVINVKLKNKNLLWKVFLWSFYINKKKKISLFFFYLLIQQAVEIKHQHIPN